MKRKTSIETYNMIKDSGLLSRRRFEVYEVLFFHGPLSAHEVVEIARKKYAANGANQTGWNARISELERAGVIESVGEKVNPTSGFKNIVWDVTDKLPTSQKSWRRESLIVQINKTEKKLKDLKRQWNKINNSGSNPHNDNLSFDI